MGRNLEVSVYMPPDEVADVEQSADDAALSVSKYVRSQVPECDIDE
jgi:hypothetical protein